MYGVLELTNAVGTVHEVADFFHELTERTLGEKLHAGTDGRQLAETLGIRMPDILQHSTITLTDERDEETTLPTLLVRYPEHPYGGEEAPTELAIGPFCWDGCQ